MNHITIRQNENKQLQRLAAQRELYSRAKNWYGWQVIVNVIIPSGFSLIALADDNAGKLGAVYGLIASFIDVFGLEARIKSLREKGAKVQEQYDCDLLELGCSPLKSVNDVTTGEIVELHNAHCAGNKNELKLQNWHSGLIAPLPLPIARLVSQYNNCDWGRRLRKRYRVFLSATYLLLGLFILYVNRPDNLVNLNDHTLINFILVLAALTPLFTFYFKQMQEQNEAIQSLERILQHIENVILDPHQLQNEQGLNERARHVQDEIYDSRSKNTQVPDFFYNYYQKQDQILMERTTERLVADIISHRQ
jgi:hypothetical protein